MTEPYQLLPAVHRIRDAERGYPLQRLLEVVAAEYDTLRAEIDGLYDDWFIETCAEWVVPYLGDLLGVTGLAPVPGGVATARALVANTIGYRRRKGTAAMLEQLSRDVTGWPARAVEYFPLLGTTQHLDHVRLGNVRTPDLRDSGPLELVGTAFDPVARTADVRHIDVRRGRHNIANVGLHLWRLAAYALSGVDACPVGRALGRWTFDPAGHDVPLVNRPRTETEVTHLAEEVNVPGPIRRRPLHDELRGAVPPTYLADPPAFEIRIAGEADPVGVDRLVCCDLTGWNRPAAPLVAVDPVLGRIALPDGVEPARVAVDYAYGFPGDVGAGPYDRRASVLTALAGTGTAWPDEVTWQRGVSRDLPAEPGVVVGTIGEAVQAWNTRPDPQPGDTGIIAVLDSATYAEDVDVRITAGTRLLLVAAAWPDQEDPDHAGVRIRRPGAIAATGPRPYLDGDVTVTGLAGAAAAGSAFVLDGFLVSGTVRAAPGELAALVVSSCTIAGGPVAADGNVHLTVQVLRSVAPGVGLTGVPGLGLSDSILHAGGDVTAAAVQAIEAHAEIESCTLLGTTAVRSLAASNAILRGLVQVARRQQGCVRFSFLPLGSRAPRRYRCRPDAPGSTVAPRFTSLDLADAGFAQLAADCPETISAGADDEGEMGAFHLVQQHRRLANLTSQLDHYVRFGLEAGVFFST